jgi:hypothetical protein
VLVKVELNFVSTSVLVFIVSSLSNIHYHVFYSFLSALEHGPLVFFHDSSFLSHNNNNLVLDEKNMIFSICTTIK